MKEIELEGRITEKKFATHSKSEHMALYIDCPKGSYLLRLRGENPFEKNALTFFIGKQVKVKGYIQDYIFFVSNIIEVK